jgi:hypothetical protein
MPGGERRVARDDRQRVFEQSQGEQGYYQGLIHPVAENKALKGIEPSVESGKMRPRDEIQASDTNCSRLSFRPISNSMPLGRNPYGRSGPRTARRRSRRGVTHLFGEPPIELLAAAVAWRRWCLSVTLRAAARAGKPNVEMVIVLPPRPNLAIQDCCGPPSRHSARLIAGGQKRTAVHIGVGAAPFSRGAAVLKKLILSGAFTIRLSRRPRSVN